jgi:hypothetical protein
MAEKCKGVNAVGEPCGNYPMDNSEYCRLHEPPKTEYGTSAVQELKVEKPPIKQIIRYVSRDGTAQEGSWKNEWIEDYLAQYLKSGYELKSAYPFEQNQFGIGMIYVLTLK